MLFVTNFVSENPSKAKETQLFQGKSIYIKANPSKPKPTEGVVESLQP